MNYFQPNQPAIRKAGKITHRGEVLPDLVTTYRVEEVPPAAHRQQEEGGVVQATNPDIAEEAQQQAEEGPAQPPNPAEPDPATPNQQQANREERGRQRQSATAAIFSQLVSLGGWGFGLAAVVVLLFSTFFGGGGEKQAAEAKEVAVATTTAPAEVKASPVVVGTTEVGTKTFIITADNPARIVVPPGHRWEIVGNPPAFGWTTDFGSRDNRGNRIQVFELVPPATEVRLPILVRKCTTPQDCAW